MGGKKFAETIFPETQEWCRQKCWEKIVAKKSGKRFLYSHEYRDQKMGGIKTREIIFPETH